MQGTLIESTGCIRPEAINTAFIALHSERRPEAAKLLL
jgi:hypothetical protein